MIEKRKNPRISISFPVECNYLPFKTYFYTVCRNLSKGGTSIFSDNFLPQGKSLKLNINLIDRIITAKAKIAWCMKNRASERYSAGLEFTEINSESKRELENFLNRITPA